MYRKVCMCIHVKGTVYTQPVYTCLTTLTAISMSWYNNYEMNYFTYQKLADTHLRFGAIRRISIWGMQFKKTYPNRRILQYQIFACVHCNLCKRSLLHSNMQDTRRRWLTRTVNVREQILQFYQRQFKNQCMSYC